MGQFGSISPGDDVRRFIKNAAWINHVTNAADRVAPSPTSSSSAGIPGQARLVLDVVNNSGTAIDAPFPILRLTEPVITLADNANIVFNDPQFMGDTPDASTGSAFVVVQGPIGSGVGRQAVLTGLTWCKVNVASEADTHATTIDGDNEKLQGGSSGVQIVWKESGTGEKWALVLLGGGGSGSTIVWGQLINTVPANSILEEECVERESKPGDGGEWFAFMLDDDDEKIKVWAGNPSLNSGIRGSVDHPLRVFGEIFSVEREVEEETVTKQVLLIMGYIDPLVGAVNFVLNPDNNKGQALIHHDGVAATVADGGPCGGE